MTTLNFEGGSTPDVTTSWTAYSKVYSSSAANGVQLPTTGRTDSNGNKPILVSTAQVYWAGRGGSRSLRIGIGSTYSSWYTVGSDSSANASGQKAINGIFLNGGNQVVTIDENGSSGFYFGRETGTSGSTDGYTNWGQLSGSLVYYQVSTAPTAVSASQSALENAVNVSWTAPSDNGGTAVTSYSVMWSYSSSFTGSTTILTGSSATSYKITGLTYGSTVYVKVAATNAVSAAAGSTSVYSSSASAYLVPPDLPLNGWANETPISGVTYTLDHTWISSIAQTGIIKKAVSTSTGGNYGTHSRTEKSYSNLELGRVYKVNVKGILLASGLPVTNYVAFVRDPNGGSAFVGAGTTLNTSTKTAFPEMTFTASIPGTYEIGFRSNQSFTVSTIGTQEWVGFVDFALTRVATDLPYRVQDNLYNASLVDHFDLATQSVGAYWWVDKNNVTQFAQNFDYSLPIGEFSDVIADGNIYYNNIKTSYDTSAVINDIKFNNIGSRYSSFGTSLLEEYDVEWVDSSSTSVTDWGARKYELTTNLWTELTRYNMVFNPTAAYSTTNITNGTTGTTLQRVLITDVNNGATGNLTTGATQSDSYGGAYVLRQKMGSLKTSTSIIYNQDEKIPVQPSTSYSATVGLRAGTGHTASLTGRCSVRWYNSDGVEIATTNGTPVAVGSTVWTSAGITATSPAGAYFASIIPFFLYSGANNTNFVYYYTCAQMYLGGGYSDWFSGDTKDNATYVYEWEGEKGNSRSIRYTNMMDTRTAELLADFATPEVRVESLTWNTAQNPVIAATVDIGSLLTITFKGTTDTYRVVGINHDISPERWMMQLQVAKVI